MFDINNIINNAIAQAVNEAIVPLAARVSDLEEANAILVMRLNEAEARLSLNHDKLVERVSEARIKLDALDAVMLHHTKAAVPSGVLSREEVAEVVRELWSDEFESEARDAAERAIDDYDFEDTIRQAVRDYDFSDAVESVLDDYDLSDKLDDLKSEIKDEIKDEIEDALDEKIGDKFDDYDLDQKINRALRNAEIRITV